MVLAFLGAIAAGHTVVAEPAETADDGSGWISLFDGKSLDGWSVKCRPEDSDKHGYWRVEDGTITARGVAGKKNNYIWLLTDREYQDFELRMKVQTYSKSTANSGVQIRSRYDDKALWLDGPQVDINPAGPWRCGFLYDETREVKAWLWPDVGGPAAAKPKHAPKNWKWFHADDEDLWNEIRIICAGTQIKTIVNGITIADYDGSGRLDDADHKAHKVGLIGHVGLQIHPGNAILIRFKDLKIRPCDL
jgi:3-keto-disaccharide hydrolase